MTKSAIVRSCFVIPLGLKPRTHRLEICCSIQLSYRTNKIILHYRDFHSFLLTEISAASTTTGICLPYSDQLCRPSMPTVKYSSVLSAKTNTDNLPRIIFVAGGRLELPRLSHWVMSPTRYHLLTPRDI